MAVKKKDDTAVAVAAAGPPIAGSRVPERGRGDPEVATQHPAGADVTITPLSRGWSAGNMVGDPVIRYGRNARLVVKLRLACSERVRDRETGAWKEGPVQYVDVVCFGTLAQHVVDHFRSGDRMVAVGSWQAEEWADRDGSAHRKVSLLARDMGPSVTFRPARYIDEIVKEAS